MEEYIEKKQPIVGRRDHAYFLAAVFCFWLATYIYAPVFGVYLQEIGFRFSAIGIILGAYGITQVLLRFPLGILSDFLQKIRKHLFVGGFIAALLSTLMLIFFDSFAMVLTARLLGGVTASMWVMATVLYSHYFSAGHASKAMGIMQFVTVATQFFSMAVSGWLVHQFGWTFPFWAGAAASILGTFFAWRIKEIQPSEEPAARRNAALHIKETIRLPHLKGLTFLSMIAHAALFITIFGFSPIYAAALGVEEQSFIWLTCAFFIPHAAASLSLVFYRLDPRWNKPVLTICFILTAVFLFAVPFTHTLASLSSVHIFIGLALGFIFPLLLSEVVLASPPAFKMSAMGFFQSFYALGIFLGPLAAGMIADQMGLDAVFMTTGFLCVAAAIFVLLSAGRRKSVFD
ncbi:MFS transporter [Domibacillus indicus]|uniref:MFS transporter n=1 Tax=Domibacillus indicus TaxID=1437523 RepID=UPI00203C6D0A|nr:MFS transporter [Domibacillus indicus]MCM3789672.1 MFS transporter [Domibacillus indicus]